jgi:ADP-ribose pyrophosphatase
MIDVGEDGLQAAKREFLEEALNYIKKSQKEKKDEETRLEPLFSNGVIVFAGIVAKDPRNTDNAWMETIAYNFHDEEGSFVDKLKLHAGDDAVKVEWKDISSDLKLYASHSDLVKKAAEIHCAHW